MSKKSEYDLNYEKIGKRIRFLRRLKEISQEDVVAATNYSTAHISNIERAKTKLSLDALVRIAKAIDTTPDQILAYELCATTEARVHLLLEVVADCTDEEFVNCLELTQFFMKAVRQGHDRKHEED